MIPILRSLPACRQWRQLARAQNKAVGFVPTMGALHDGHLSLVRESLKENDLTIVSIFVNPAQFAPHEDLATYPRTLERDVDLLSTQSVQVTLPNAEIIHRKPDAVFAPTVQDMYPSGIDQDVSAQKGTFIEVKGYSHQMEGKSRPTFFRGVATVVLKLLNAVEPTNAYFGQKDIQQSLILRRLCQDLLLSHPDPEHLHVIPIVRDPSDGLALSSRNAYLTPDERPFATTLRRALEVIEKSWADGKTKDVCMNNAIDLVNNKIQEIQNRELPVQLKLDYIELNDSRTLDIVDAASTKHSFSYPVILSGAMWVGRTRLIDNIILGKSEDILY